MKKRVTRVLILGISGFAGRHLYACLKGRASLELFGTASRPIQAEERLFFGSDAKLLRCDIRKSSKIIEILNLVRPDQIYFLSALVTVAKSNLLATSIYKTNVTGTANFYDAVKNICPGVRILATGSAEEYGIVDPLRLPITETTPLAPVSLYGLSKRLAEEIGLYYHRVHGLDIRFTRTFHYSGPTQPSSFVVSDFARQVVETENGRMGRLLVGNLGAKRDFTDIRDVVRAYVLLMDSGSAGSVYNVCAGETVEIQLILEKMISLCRSKVIVETDQQKLRPLDVPEFKGDNSLLVNTTGWARIYTLDQTILDVVNYWREVLGSRPG